MEIMGIEPMASCKLMLSKRSTTELNPRGVEIMGIEPMASCKQMLSKRSTTELNPRKLRKD